MRKLNVLSLFDGMSCGRIAFDRLGIPVNYFASEIDKYAIQVAKKNYPDITHVGDVKDVDYDYNQGYLLFMEEGKTYPEYMPESHWLNVDILIGGSPCQGFSFAGDGKAFKDERSVLVYEYERLLNSCKPRYFILENVKMTFKNEYTITELLDHVMPVTIDSNLVSAQNRQRLYWVGQLTENGTYTTVDIPQPEDKKIFLKDILEDEVEEKYYLSEKAIKSFMINHERFKGKFKVSTPDDKGVCLTGKSQGSLRTQTYVLGNTNPSGKGQNGQVYSDAGKAPTLTTNNGEGFKLIQLGRSKNLGGEYTDKSPTMTSNQWEYNNVLLVKEATTEGFVPIEDGECFNGSHMDSETKRGRSMKDKSNCLTSAGAHALMRYYGGRIRRLTPVECERLQTVPDGYTESVDFKSYLCNIKELYSNGKIGNIESSANLNDVTGRQKQISYEDSVVCITEENLNIEQQNYLLSKVTKKKNVNIVIEKLGKNEEVQNECVIDITKITLDIEIHSILTKLEKSYDQDDIRKELMVKMSTGKLWKITYEESGLVEMLFIILILIKLITQFQTYIFVNDKSNISLSITNLNKYHDSLLRVELSDLKIENTTYCSNSQRYKMLGNGWTVDVITHILSNLLEDEF